MWHASFLPFHHSFLASEVFFFSDLFGLCRIPLMPMLSLEGVRLSKLVSAEPEVGGGYGPIFDDGGDSRDAHQGLNQPFPTHRQKKKKQQTIFPGDNAPISSSPTPCPSHKISNALPTHIPLPPLVKTEQKHTSQTTSKGPYLVPFFSRGGQEEIPHTPKI